LNITSINPSQKPSIASLGRPRTWLSAMPKRVAQKTTWSTSLWVAASKKLWGTMCSRNPLKFVGAPLGRGALGSGAGSTTPTPGRVRCTAARPMTRAIAVMTQKYASDLIASRPMRLRSSPCPAIPMTRVPKMIGTTTDLIIRRNMVESGLSWTATDGASQPSRIPAPIPRKIQWVRLRRRAGALIPGGRS